MSEFGQGLRDPGSELGGRFMESMRGSIGAQTGASKRLAALEGAQSGMGAGDSAELMGAQRDIGVAGQAAAGQSAADYMMKAPGLGVSALGSTFGPGVGLTGIAAGELTASAGRASGEGMQQQDLAYRRAQQEAQWRQQQQSQQANEQMQWEIAQLGLGSSLL